MRELDNEGMTQIVAPTSSFAKDVASGVLVFERLGVSNGANSIERLGNKNCRVIRG